jgi:hypothetical protein
VRQVLFDAQPYGDAAPASKMEGRAEGKIEAKLKLH